MTSKKMFLWLDLLILSPIIISIIFLPGAHYPFGIGKVLFFEVVVGLALILKLFLVKKNEWHFPKIQWGIPTAFVVFVMALTISALFGVDIQNSFFGNTYRILGVVFYFFLVIWLFLLIPVLKNPQRRKQALYAWVGVSAFVGCYAFGELVGWVPKFGNAWERSSFTLGNPIMLAGALMIPIFICFGLILEAKKKRTKIWLVLAILSMLLGMYASGTRGGMLGIIAGLGVFLGYLFFQDQKNRKRNVLFFLGGMFVCILVFFGARNFSAPENIAYRLTHFEGQNVSDRLAYWNLAVQGWKEYPVFGVGYQNFSRVADQNYQNKNINRENIWIDKVHNQMLEWLVTGGSVTLGAYLALLMTVLLVMAKRVQTHFGGILIAALVGHEIQNAFAFYSSTSLVHVVLLFAFVVALSGDVLEKTSHQISFIGKRFLMGGILMIEIFYFGWFLFPTVRQQITRLSAIEQMDANPIAAGKLIESNRNHWFVFDSIVDQRIFLDGLKILAKQEDHSKEAQDMASSALMAGKLAVAQHPFHARAWYEFGRNYSMNAEIYQQPVFPEAYLVAQHVLDLAPFRDEGFLLLAGLSVQDNDIEQAIVYAKKALEVTTEKPKVLFQIGQYYGFLGDIKEGSSVVLQAAKLSTSSLGDIGQYAWAIDYFVEQKDFASVVVLYEQAYVADSSQTQILPNLAASYAAVGRFQEAVETARLLKQLDPNMTAQADQFISQIQEILP